MRYPLATLLALAIALGSSGCSQCVSLITTTVAAAPASQSTAYINGVTHYYGAILPNADVTARMFGTGEALASTKAGPDGTFYIELPPKIQPGDVVELVGIADGHTVLNVGTTQRIADAKTAKQRLLLADTGKLVVLDENSTQALIVMAPRVIAAIQMGTEAAKAAVLSALNAVAAALDPNSKAALTDSQYDALAAQVIDSNGQILQTEAARSAVATNIPASAVAVIAEQEEALAVAIRQAVTDGHPRPDANLTGPLAVGPQTVPPVFDDSTKPPATNPNTGANTGGNPTTGSNTPTTGTKPDGSDGATKGGGSGGGGSASAPATGAAVVDLVASSPADGVYGTTTGSITGDAQ